MILIVCCTPCAANRLLQVMWPITAVAIISLLQLPMDLVYLALRPRGLKGHTLSLMPPQELLLPGQFFLSWALTWRRDSSSRGPFSGHCICRVDGTQVFAVW